MVSTINEGVKVLEKQQTLMLERSHCIKTLVEHIYNGGAKRDELYRTLDKLSQEINDIKTLIETNMTLWKKAENDRIKARNEWKEMLQLTLDSNNEKILNKVEAYEMAITNLVSHESNMILALSKINDEGLRSKMENCIETLKEVLIYGRKNYEISIEIQTAAKETETRLIQELIDNKK
jgi:hypothetical protein